MLPLRHLRCDRSLREPPAGWTDARQNMCDSLGHGFLIALLGGRGVGKTQLACDVAMMVCAMGRTARYVRAMTIFFELRAAFKREDSTEADVIDTFAGVSLLVIDEFQVRSDSAFEGRTLDHIIDTRYAAMTDTIIVANMTPAELHANVGRTITDRFKETGGAIECDWPSFREPQECSK